MVTGVLHRSIFSFPDSGFAVLLAWFWCIIGLGVFCLSRDFTYSDSNWNSSDGVSSSWRVSNAEDIACGAIITVNYTGLMTQTLVRVRSMVGVR